MVAAGRTNDSTEGFPLRVGHVSMTRQPQRVPFIATMRRADADRAEGLVHATAFEDPNTMVECRRNLIPHAAEVLRLDVGNRAVHRQLRHDRGKHASEVNEALVPRTARETRRLGQAIEIVTGYRDPRESRRQRDRRAREPKLRSTSDDACSADDCLDVVTHAPELARAALAVTGAAAKIPRPRPHTQRVM